MNKNLELYIHIPFCVKKCSYCDFLSFLADEKTQEEYTRYLVKEIQYYGQRLKEYTVSTIFIGGGTPSWLTEELMLYIMSAVKSSFNVLPQAEVTIECNPGTVTLSKLSAYVSAGINRLSIGLQSTNDEELKVLGRIHTYEQFLKTYQWAREAGFLNINVDLMSAIPYQNTDRYIDSLQKVIRLKPEHISAYSLIIEKGTPFYDMYKFDAVKQEAGMPTEALPSEEETCKMYRTTQVMLEQSGYKQYETSNYAKKGYECKHNIGYWTRENYLGVGLGAASLIDNVRYTNKKDLYEYLNSVNNIMETDPEDEVKNEWYKTNIHADATVIERKAQMEEFMFLGLRMNAGVLRSDFEKQFGVAIEAIYKAQIDELKEKELLIAKEGRSYLSEKGSDIANYVMAKFLL